MNDTPDASSQPMKAPARKVRGRLIIAVLVVGLIAGYLLRGCGPAASPMGGHEAHDDSVAPTSVRAEVWTCSMHPQIRASKPGKCPICGMDLIPVADTGAADQAGPRELVVSDAAKALMSIGTSPVERKFVTAEVRMVGKVDYDETKLAYITAWVSGRIDRLYVDYTGIQVNQGDHMVYLYSPELLVAAAELKRTAEALRTMNPSAPDVLRDSARTTVQASREKLRRLGLTDAQIADAEQKGATSDHVTIYAPIGGTVIQRDGQEGMYVEVGTRIYTIADLSQVWVKLNAYESDLLWLRFGQKVEFTAEAYPGEVFEGRISFIDPVLDPMTRTVNVRVSVPNPDGRLKPEMFVRAVVRTNIATGERVMEADLAGKWISPMHPEIISDKPGKCPVCGMDLVPAEKLGYVTATANEADMPLVIPASAPLITGARAVVYVELPGRPAPTFEGREVVLGPRAGHYYIVDSGLEEGELVVTEGNFKIDSSLQILAKPSMMSPEGGITPAAHQHGEAAPAARPARSAAVSEAFRIQVRGLYAAYLAIGDALVRSDADASAKAAGAGLEALKQVDMGLLEGDAHTAWMRFVEVLQPALQAMAGAKDLDELRKHFAPLSSALGETVETLGIAPGDAVYRMHCPMALGGKGADWLQTVKEVRNPYYGESMLTCGSVVGRLDEGAGGAVDDAAHEGARHD